jgi:HEAT repeat protein
MTPTGKTARNRTLEALSEFFDKEQQEKLKKYLDDPEKVEHLRVMANRMLFLTKKASQAEIESDEQQYFHAKTEADALVWLLGEVLR